MVENRVGPAELRRRLCAVTEQSIPAPLFEIHLCDLKPISFSRELSQSLLCVLTWLFRHHHQTLASLVALADVSTEAV